MEIEGHPTQDLVEELERRGALRVRGSSSGPDADALLLLRTEVGDLEGSWIFLRPETYATGFDELPS